MMKDQMRVGIATDHGGFELKEELVAHNSAPPGTRCSTSARMPTIPMMTIRIS